MRVSNGCSNGHAPIAIKKILAPTDSHIREGLEKLRFARKFGRSDAHILEPMVEFNV